MSQPRQIIAVDMDEVIADALGEGIARYNHDFPQAHPLTRDDLHGRYIWDAIPEEHLPTLERHLHTADYFAGLAIFPDAQRVLERLQERYDIFIASAAMEVPSSFNAKYEWLARHFPFISPARIVFCGDKSILRADYLIDDNPRQLRLFEGRTEGQTGREGILFTAPANVHVTGFRRVDNWLDVERMFLG